MKAKATIGVLSVLSLLPALHALAQAGATDTTNSFVSVLLEKGILGLVCAALGSAVIVLYRRNETLQQARIDDAKAAAKLQADRDDRLAGYLEEVTKALKEERRP